MVGESGAKARILVVDDSKLMRKAAMKMLGDEFDVVVAEDGVDAWAQVGADHSIQVVFTDLNMPRMDGYEFLQAVRAADDPGLQGLPVIVVTGAENDEAARMKALDQGATDFITKPFTTSDLVARARAHSKYQRVTRQLQAQVATDPLTGLANKSGFLDRLQQDIAYARRHLQPTTVVRLEIEEFRRLFLYHGRELADSLVLQVARLLRARIRKEDTAARIGLGGFALSLPGGEAAGVSGMIDRLRAELAGQAPKDAEGEPVHVRLSAAVLSPDLADGPSAQEVFDACQAQLDAPAAVRAREAEPAPAPDATLEIDAAAMLAAQAAAEAAAQAEARAAAEAEARAIAEAEARAIAEAAAEEAAAREAQALADAAAAREAQAAAEAAARREAQAAAEAAAAREAQAAAEAAAAREAQVAAEATAARHAREAAEAAAREAQRALEAAAAREARAAAEATAAREAQDAPKPAPLRLDPLLDLLSQGDAKPLAEKLPQAIGRLLPLFRLLGPNQRAQLIQFLQKLG